MTPSGSPNLRIVGWGWRRRSARDRERESQAFNQARRLVLSLDVAAPRATSGDPSRRNDAPRTVSIRIGRHDAEPYLAALSRDDRLSHLGVTVEVAGDEIWIGMPGAAAQSLIEQFSASSPHRLLEFAAQGTTEIGERGSTRVGVVVAHTKDGFDVDLGMGFARPFRTRSFKPSCQADPEFRSRI